MNVTIEYDDGRARQALNRLIAAGQNLTPAMKKTADALESAAQRAFEEQTAPAGKKWAQLSETTKTRREKKGSWPGQILRTSGDLKESISSARDSKTAVAGTNLIYAKTHQVGAKKGEFAGPFSSISTRRRHDPIPWGDIPARPFIGVSFETEEEIIDILNRYLRAAANK